MTHVGKRERRRKRGGQSEIQGPGKKQKETVFKINAMNKNYPKVGSCLLSKRKRSITFQVCVSTLSYLSFHVKAKGKENKKHKTD